MRNVIKIIAAVVIIAGANSPAFAHGGKGGGGGSPALVKARADAAAKACQQDADMCIGFGTHYYGQ